MIDATLDGECSVVPDEGDEHVLLLNYPITFTSSYIVPHIRLEIGPLAAWLPGCQKRSFPLRRTSPRFSRSWQIQAVSVPTILAERTFWEKVTILHQEHFRPEQLHVPLRYSRHYYDLFMMARSSCASDAINNVQLLEGVVDFKKKFYPRAWARYDLAVPGSLELLPAPHSVQSLQGDYESMKNMIFGEYLSWDEIMKTLADLQIRINSSHHPGE